MKKNILLDVVVPAYNEKNTFTILVKKLLKLKIRNVRLKIIIVESNSDDGTRDDALKFRNHKNIKLILQSRPSGKGNAVIEGFKHVTGDYVIIQDSDLEYDPKMRVVAEWRHPDGLYQDHVNSAVTDIMLDGANKGDKLGHAWYLRPPARCTKAYCVVRRWLGKGGPIPQGWTAIQFLQMLWVYKRHRQIKRKLLELAEIFEKEQGYRPPFWELISIARRVKEDL